MTRPKNIMEVDLDKIKRMQGMRLAFIFIDLRSPAEYQAGHHQGALNVPGEEFLEKLPGLVPQKETPIVVYDADGEGAASLIEEAENLGYLNIVNLAGGFKGRY